MKIRNTHFLGLIVVLILFSQACALPFGGSTSDETKAQKAETESSTGTIPIPVEVSVPEGVRVVEKTAIWAPIKDEPELHTVYVGVVVESPTAVLGFNLDYQVWRADDKEKASEFKTNHRLWLAVPAQQGGAAVIRLGDYPAWMMPKKIEIQLLPGDFYGDRQKDLDMLNNTTFPNPYFSVNSVDMTAAKDPASGLFNVEARGKVMNNLPVEAGVSGLFFFYNGEGKVIGLTTTLCSDSKSYACGGTLAVKIPGQTEGELDAQVPYPLDNQPAKVVLYPIVDLYIAGFLNQIQ